METKKRRRRRRKRKQEKKNMLSIIIMVIALGVFAFSGYKLLSIFLEYQKGSNEYKDLQQIAIQTVVPGGTEGDQAPKFTVDFDALKEINSEVVAWIRFDNPDKISYPVVPSGDNAKYLNRTFEGKRNGAGTLFVDMSNSKLFTDRNTFIYGHNMKDGSMFGKLRQYKSKQFCEENPYFYIYTPDGMVSTYQVFATSIVKDTSKTYTTWYNNDTEFADYIKYIQGTSLYDTDVEVEGTDLIVSLSTCTNVVVDERLVVHGVKISSEPMGE